MEQDSSERFWSGLLPRVQFPTGGIQPDSLTSLGFSSLSCVMEFVIPASPGPGKLRVAHGEEAWHRTPWDWLFGVQRGEREGPVCAATQPRCEASRWTQTHPPGPAAALAALSPTLLPPGELEAGLLAAAPFPRGATSAAPWPSIGPPGRASHPPVLRQTGWRPSRTTAPREPL